MMTKISWILLLLPILLIEPKAQIVQEKQRDIFPLPSVSIATSDELRQVMFDSRGMMWMSTSSGILKYDGYSFLQISSTLTSPFSCGLYELCVLASSAFHPHLYLPIALYGSNR